MNHLLVINFLTKETILRKEFDNKYELEGFRTFILEIFYFFL
jgi:hypothetical protein